MEKHRTSTIELGIVSDEISPDFRDAITYGLQWGVKIFELRCLKSGRFPAVDKAEFTEVRELVDRYQITISAVSPGVFKHPLSNRGELERECSETLPRTFELAKSLGAGLVIVFGFQRIKGEPSARYYEAIDFFRRAAEMAQHVGIRIAVENEPGFWCDTGKNTAQMIRDVGSASFGANWDPCNGYGTDERPYPDGYTAVKDFILNVHAKDTAEGALIKCVPIGEGAIDWKGQLQAIVRDRIVRHVTIETHCLPLIEKSKQNVDTIRRYLKDIHEKQEAVP